MALQFYGSLGVALNGEMLKEQCGVIVTDRVGEPCRVTVESAVPAQGFEVHGRALLGEHVNLSVFLRDPDRKITNEVLHLRGAVVGARSTQAKGLEKPLITEFTVEELPRQSDAPRQAL